ncbi:hypothetical protein ACHAXR_003893 [Thalassiosira sp. AJA248-18]
MVDINNESTSLLRINGVANELENAPSADYEVETTSIKSYIRLIIFFIASIIAGGIIPGQNEYNRLFCEAGLFRYACSSSFTATIDEDGFSSDCCQAQWILLANVMNTLTLAMTILFLVSGLLFDMIGGRYSAILGCTMLCIGITIISTLVHYLSENVSPIVETLTFIMGVILCDCGSVLVNVGFYGFIWHLPTRQALVLSLSNSCLSCASFIPLVLSAFMTWSGYSLSLSLRVYGSVILCFSGTLCWMTVPSVEEYRSQALKVLGLPIPRRSVKGVKGAIKQLREGILVFREPIANFHKLSIGACVLAYLPAFIWMSMAEPLGKEIFQSYENEVIIGEEGGDDEQQPSLGVMFLKINTIIGLFVGPFCGVLVDLCQHPSEGLVEIGILLSVCFAIVAPLVGVASWTIQTIVLVCVCTSQTLCYLYVARYAVVFAYPNRVGTVSGLLVAALGILTLPGALILSVGIALIGYIWPASIISAIGAIAWVRYVIYLKRTKPFPKRPILLPVDELDIAKHFSVATIEDAAYVANMSPNELLALSASNAKTF